MTRPREGRRWGDELWLGFAVGFLCLTPVSTFFAFASGFDFDPNDYRGSYYLEQIPRRQAMMAITLLVPAVAAGTAVAAALVQPRSWPRTVAAAAILVLAAVDIWFCWVLGSEAVDSARRYSEMF